MSQVSPSCLPVCVICFVPALLMFRRPLSLTNHTVPGSPVKPHSPIYQSNYPGVQRELLNHAPDLIKRTRSALRHGFSSRGEETDRSASTPFQLKTKVRSCGNNIRFFMLSSRKLQYILGRSRCCLCFANVECIYHQKYSYRCSKLEHRKKKWF